MFVCKFTTIPTIAALALILAACAADTSALDNDRLEQARLARRLDMQAWELQVRIREAAELRARLDAEAASRPLAAPVLVAAMRTGEYECDLSRRVELKQVDPHGRSATLHWQGRDYPMQAVRAATGALRLEDPQAGLVWLTILGKSILLDSRDGKQLANDCNHVS
ncbi:MAG: hypothetical protein R3E87_08430 [Burkholderiaceae bacterium]